MLKHDGQSWKIRRRSGRQPRQRSSSTCSRYCSQNVRFTCTGGVRRDHGVDAVAEVGEELIPFEVKYRSQHTGFTRFEGLLELCQQKSIGRGYVVTKSLDFGAFRGCLIPTLKSCIPRHYCAIGWERQKWFRMPLKSVFSRQPDPGYPQHAVWIAAANPPTRGSRRSLAFDAGNIALDHGQAAAGQTDEFAANSQVVLPVISRKLDRFRTRRLTSKTPSSGISRRLSWNSASREQSSWLIIGTVRLIRRN